MVWKLAQDGTQQTVLALEEGLQPLDATMLWYVEPRSGTVGPITLDIPARAAARLLRSPPVPPELAERVTAELRQRLPTMPVPVPQMLPPAEKVTGRAQPYVRLINGTLPVDPAHGRGSARHVGGGLYEVPLARLAFRYGPLTVPSTIRPPPRRVSHDGKLFDLVRDRAGEQKAIEALTLIGSGPRRAACPGVLSTRPYRRLRAERGGRRRGPGWRLSCKSCPELRAEGWDVEIDDDFPIHVVTADSDFSAELEEASGIDWLELHLGVSVGGEQVDLVPALVRLITDADATVTLDGDDDRPFLLTLPDGRLLSVPLGRIRPTLRALMELYAAAGLASTVNGSGFPVWMPPISQSWRNVPGLT